MKGFIKILEAVIASIIILTSLTFFFSSPTKETGWNDALLQLRAEDALSALYKNGSLTYAVKNNDPVIINNTLMTSTTSIISPTIEYSLEVDGTVNPIIYVGCLCTATEKTLVESLLSPMNFKYHGRSISIRVSNDSLNSINNETNVLFTFKHEDYVGNMQGVNAFLERGGTLFRIGDTVPQDFTDGFTAQTFGLNVAGPAPNLIGSFDGEDNENRTTFKVSKYFRNVTGLGMGQTFSFQTASSIQNDNNTVIISTNGLSLVKTSKNLVNGKGRTVWMANFDTTTPSPNMLNLTKSLFMWGSGEHFSLDLLPKTPGQKSMKSEIVVNDQDVYTASLTLWRVF